ncbi:MAG: ABC transporter ATP-binding protein [Prolixibacteraceae bacterium]|jgi:zinc transport system ATP-binding protein|nr:ABC transporter ATP-binding protein [Prolixibacteraceae bacterium]
MFENLTYMVPLIEIRHLTVGYEENIILSDVSLTIHDKDFIGVIGPNGGGKTTLLKAILGLLQPFRGEVVFHDCMTEGNHHRIGYLPQINNIDRKFPISVSEVVKSGLMSKKRIIKKYAQKDLEYAGELMNEMGIYEIRNKAIGELSGGQIQRTLLCRALVNQPKLLVLDEPNTYVDNRFEKELYEKLRRFNENIAILLVSHDIGTISTYVKSIACVNHSLHYHPGNKITPELMEAYECPIQIITHGKIPHTVLHQHES